MSINSLVKAYDNLDLYDESISPISENFSKLSINGTTSENRFTIMNKKDVKTQLPKLSRDRRFSFDICDCPQNFSLQQEILLKTYYGNNLRLLTVKVAKKIIGMKCYGIQVDNTYKCLEKLTMKDRMLNVRLYKLTQHTKKNYYDMEIFNSSIITIKPVSRMSTKKKKAYYVFVN